MCVKYTAILLRNSVKVSKLLAINGGDPISHEPLRYVWPIINDDIRRVVLEQLSESISIYDDSGVFGRFEDTYASAHNMPYALLTNSGTSALQTAYYSLLLYPGDEIIVPVYTFHATVSPMMHFGAIPVFADSDAYGQFDPNELDRLVSPRTKAVVVTHMWGYTVDIEPIREFCNKHELTLIEDCSHAHGATVNGTTVGSFGDMSIWSLQGQKIVSGGEGGIILFRNRSDFERGVLYGHYNKRCHKQIQDPHISEFSLTGAGLKLRASTINTAIALYHFENLKEINANKTMNAELFMNNMLHKKGVSVLAPRPSSTNSWYSLVIKYKASDTGVAKERFVAALHAEGLVEFDIPGSTTLLHREPLFNTPNTVFPALYDHNLLNCDKMYPGAQEFDQQIIKLPVWEDTETVSLYLEGINKVLRDLNTL